MMKRLPNRERNGQCSRIKVSKKAKNVPSRWLNEKPMEPVKNCGSFYKSNPRRKRRLSKEKVVKTMEDQGQLVPQPPARITLEEYMPGE